jgi:hypothetical protein
MKSLKHYLMENKTEYRFRMKFAFRPSTEQLDKIKSALEGLGLSDFGSIKSLPVMHDSRDFPKLGAVEPHMAEVVFEYPVTAEKLTEIVTRECDVKPETVLIYNSLQSRDREELLNPYERSDEPESILLKPYEDEKQAELYGDKYNENFLKGLRKERDGAKASNTTSSDRVGTLSPVGSTVVKKPDPRKLR